MPYTTPTTSSFSMGNFRYEPTSRSSGAYVPPQRRGESKLSQNWRQGQPQSSSPPTRSPFSPKSWMDEQPQSSSPPASSPSPSSLVSSSRRNSTSSLSSLLSSISLTSSSSSSTDNFSLSSSYSSSPPRGFSSSNWREGAPGPLSGDIKNSKPSFDNLRPGHVLHLGKREMISKTSRIHKRTERRGDNPFRHPVVITQKLSDGIVRCHLLTSFNSSGLRYKKGHEKNKIALCDNDQGERSHEGTRLLTFMPGSDKFQKLTYVNFYDQEDDGEFEIEYENLESWDTTSGQPITFDQESLERIKLKLVR